MYQDVSLFIDGSWGKASGGKATPVVNPATGDQIGTFAHANKADLERAVQAAQKGFQAWRKVSPFERYKIMRKAGELMRQRVDEIAKTMTLEQGKPVGEAKMELANAADVIDWFAEEGRRAYGWIIPPRFEGTYQLAMKEPVGPVAAFTPWNFP
ncbi:MAG: aldehyde dehydrogenase family protein, partial [Hyphomicrobiales bacterium]|nr:aldehyde dehydrogenase family protein [Hyphomicrobiales bacterium]